MASFGKNKLQDMIATNFIKLIDKNYMITSLAFEKSSEAMAIESEGSFILVNQAFARLFKYQNPEDLIGYKMSSIVNDNDKERLKDLITSPKKDFTSASSDEFKCHCKNKSEIYIDLSISAFEL